MRKTLKMGKGKKGKKKNRNMEGKKNRLNYFHSKIEKKLPIITFGALIIWGILANYSSLREFYYDFLSGKPIEQSDYTKIEFISELKKQNNIYDTTGSTKAVDKIVEILVYNFYTLKLKNPKDFDNTISKLLFYNSSSIDYSGNWLPFSGLTLISINFAGKKSNARFISRIKEPNFKPQTLNLPFEIWWSEQVVLNDRLGNSFTRKSLLLSYVLFNLQDNFADLGELEKVSKFNFLGIKLGDKYFETASVDAIPKNQLSQKKSLQKSS